MLAQATVTQQIGRGEALFLWEPPTVVLELPLVEGARYGGRAGLEKHRAPHAGGHHNGRSFPPPRNTCRRSSWQVKENVSGNAGRVKDDKTIQLL